MSNAADSRAIYAVKHEATRGRLYPEPESQSRTPFQRDRDRIIHSAAFRRLQYKTQVFVYHEGDHYRTRLTHSLEVAQISRSIARALRLDEDLAEAIALGHDLGHPAFGHAGEDALQEMMQPFGGFDHNAQTLKVLTKLEQRYASFDGLNLTWETLEGTVKHNGPLTTGDGFESVPEAVLAYSKQHDLELHTYASLEAQVAGLADDIAYNNHDIDDGLRAELFEIDDLKEVPLAGSILKEVKALYPDIELSRLIHEVVRRMIDRLILDVIEETGNLLQIADPRSVDDVRAFGAMLVGSSDEMKQADHDLKDFLRQHMYRHDRVNAMTAKARRVVVDLFSLYLNEPERLPENWQLGCNGAGDLQTAHRVADFIGGMTDRYALNDHERLFGK